MKNNKQVLAGVIFLVLLGAGFLVWLFLDPFHKITGPKIAVVPTPIESRMKLAVTKYPQLNLNFKGDEYRLSLSLTKIPAPIKKVEYDFIYLAHDKQGQEFEKGQYDSFSVDNSSVSRDILLGTSSCTTGTCRYRYDRNVSQGRITLTLRGKTGSLQMEAPFWFIRAGKSQKISGHQVQNMGNNICVFYKSLRPIGGKEASYLFSCLPGGRLLAKGASVFVKNNWQPQAMATSKGRVSW